MTTNGEKEGLPGVMGYIPEPGSQAQVGGWYKKAAGRGPDSPNNVDQNHELDQAEDDAHLLVAHEYHSGSVVLKEEGGQLILEPLSHGGPGREPRAEPLHSSCSLAEPDANTHVYSKASGGFPAPYEGQGRAGGTRSQESEVSWKCLG